MIYEVFAFFDTKAEVFSQPFYALNAAVAVRIASERCADMQDVVGRHPGDFTLFRLGTFDDQVGSFGQAGAVSICPLIGLVPKGQPAGGFDFDSDRSPLQSRMRTAS